MSDDRLRLALLVAVLIGLGGMAQAEIGGPCDDSCESGVCVPDDAGDYCTDTCTSAAECPADFGCPDVGGEEKYCIRLPQDGQFGDVCETPEDCEANRPCYQPPEGDSICSATCRDSNYCVPGFCCFKEQVDDDEGFCIPSHYCLLCDNADELPSHCTAGTVADADVDADADGDADADADAERGGCDCGGSSQLAGRGPLGSVLVIGVGLALLLVRRQRRR